MSMRLGFNAHYIYLKFSEEADLLNVHFKEAIIAKLVGESNKANKSYTG